VIPALQAVGEIELALVRLDQGRPDDAAMALDAVPRVRPGGDLGPLVLGRADAVRSALCLATGDLIGARRAAERMPPGLWRDVALARVLLADGATSEAATILRPLEPTSPRQFVVVGMLRALSIVDQEPEMARDHAAAALQTAAAVGLHHTVIAAGPGVTDLIESATWALPTAWVERTHGVIAAAAGRSPGGRLPGLVEQLTSRERDALRYLPSRLTVPEIARELGVSPNTLKTHLKGLYRKLGVTAREDAISAAKALDLLR
jgi:LuxR family maltose regulon positive regulatory protein